MEFNANQGYNSAQVTGMELNANQGFNAVQVTGIQFNAIQGYHTPYNYGFDTSMHQHEFAHDNRDQPRC